VSLTRFRRCRLTVSGRISSRRRRPLTSVSGIRDGIADRVPVRTGARRPAVITSPRHRRLHVHHRTALAITAYTCHQRRRPAETGRSSSVVTVPALRHRIEDLEELVPLLLRELTRRADVRLGRDAMRQLTKLPWPGNVAQLRSVLADAVALQRSGTIGVEKLPAECRSLTRRRLTQPEALERDAIVRSLLENGGNKADAAEALGMSRITIYRKIKEFGIA
jgi:transcriptional regulator with AAA-type ATPase domain